MTVRLKVTGYIEIQDDEHDPDHETGLTAEAYDTYAVHLGLDDLDFQVVD